MQFDFQPEQKQDNFDFQPETPPVVASGFDFQPDAMPSMLPEDTRLNLPQQQPQIVNPPTNPAAAFLQQEPIKLDVNRAQSPNWNIAVTGAGQPTPLPATGIEQIAPTYEGRTPLPEKLYKGVGSGVAGMISGAGGAVRTVGMEEAGKTLNLLAETMQEKYQIPDADLTYQIASGLGSMATFMIPGIGVENGVLALATKAPLIAKALGISTMAFLESATEGGSVYNRAKEKGWQDQAARKAAIKTFAANLPINYVTDKILIGEKGNFLKKALSEGGQEGYQQALSNWLSEDPLADGLVMSAVVGAITGGVVSAGQSAVSKLAPTPPLPENLQKPPYIVPPTPQVAPQQAQAPAVPQSAMNPVQEITPEIRSEFFKQSENMSAVDVATQLDTLVKHGVDKSEPGVYALWQELYKQKLASHPAGKVTGIDQDTKLPIVDTKQPATPQPEPTIAPVQPLPPLPTSAQLEQRKPVETPITTQKQAEPVKLDFQPVQEEAKPVTPAQEQTFTSEELGITPEPVRREYTKEQKGQIIQELNSYSNDELKQVIDQIPDYAPIAEKLLEERENYEQGNEKPYIFQELDDQFGKIRPPKGEWNDWEMVLGKKRLTHKPGAQSGDEVLQSLADQGIIKGPYLADLQVEVEKAQKQEGLQGKGPKYRMPPKFGEQKKPMQLDFEGQTVPAGAKPKSATPGQMGLFEEAAKPKFEVPVKKTDTETQLTEQAKQHSTVEGFVKAITEDKGGVGYPDYAPWKRLVESGNNDKPITDFGIKPDEKITIYRGVDNASQKTIKEGDYVALSYDLAKSYTGNRVISKEVPASSIRVASDDGLTIKDFNNRNEMHIEAVYNPNPLVKQSQLADIWNKAHGKTGQVMGLPITEGNLPLEKRVELLRKSGNEEAARKLEQQGEIKFRTPKDIAVEEITANQKDKLDEIGRQIFGYNDFQYITPEQMMKLAGQGKAREALGMYLNDLKYIVENKGNMIDTGLHESVHEILDRFYTPKEKSLLLDYAKKHMKLGTKGFDPNMTPEENIAEMFKDYWNKTRSFYGKIKLIFDKIMNRIRRVLGRRNRINELYNDMATGKFKQEAPARRESEISGGKKDIRITPDLDKLGEILYDKQYGEKGNISDRDGEGVHRASERPGMAKHFILQFKRDGYIHLPQQKIYSPQDIAFAFKALKDEAVEKLYIVGLKNNKPVAIECLTIGTINSSLFGAYDAMPILISKKADSAYIVHNHPSGNLEYSKDDMISTKKLKNTLNENDIDFMGHIIIDGKRYGMISPDMTYGTHEHAVSAEKTTRTPVYKKYIEWITSPDDVNMTPSIQATDDVFETIKGINTDTEKNIIVIYANTKNKAISTEVIPLGDSIAKHINKTAPMIRAINILIVGKAQTSEQLKGLNQSLHRGGLALIDYIGIRDYGYNSNWPELGAQREEFNKQEREEFEKPQPSAEEPKYRILRSSKEKAEAFRELRLQAKVWRELTGETTKLDGIYTYSTSDINTMSSELRQKISKAREKKDGIESLKSQIFQLKKKQKLSNQELSGVISRVMMATPTNDMSLKGLALSDLIDVKNALIEDAATGDISKRLKESKTELKGIAPTLKEQIAEAANINKPEKKTFTTDQLIKKQMQDEARGMKTGYKEGSLITKEYLISKYRQGQQKIKEMVQYIERSIPDKDKRGLFLKGVTEATTVKRRMSLIERVDKYANKINLEKEISEIERLSEPAKTMDLAYQDKMLSIVDNINLERMSPNTINRLKHLRNYMERHGDIIGLSRETRDQLKTLAQKSIKDFTPEAIKDLRLALERVKQLGKLKLKMKNKNVQRIRLTNIIKLVNGTHSTDIEDTGNEKIDRTRDALLNFYYDTLHTGRVFNAMDNYKSGPNQELHKRLVRAEKNANLEHRNSMADALERMQKITSELTEKEQIDITTLLYHEQGDYDQVNALMDEYKLDKLPEKTDKYKKVMDLAREVVGKNESRIAAVYEDINNEHMGHVENYYPRYYEKEYSVSAADTVIRGRHRRVNVDQPFTRERQEGVKQIPRVDLLGVIDQALSDQTYYIHMQPEIEDIKYLVKSKQYLKEAGDRNTKYWSDHLDIVARRGDLITKQPTDYLLKTARINLSKAVLGYKLSSIVKQPLAVLDAVAYSTAKYGPETSSEILKEFTKSWAIPGYSKAYIEKSSALLERQGAGEQAIEEAIQQTNGSKKFYDKFIYGGMKALQWADVKTAAGVQKGVENVLIKNNVPNARQEAEYVMELVSGTNSVTQKPHFLSQSEWKRTLATFQNFMMNRWGIIIHDMIISGVIKDPSILKKMSSLIGIGIMMLASIADQEVNYYIYKLFHKDKELKQRPAALTAAMAIPGNIPVFGNYIDLLIPGGYGGSDIPLTRAGEDLFTGIRSAAYGKDDAAKTRGAIKAMRSAVGMGLGVPGTYQFADILKSLTEESGKEITPQQQYAAEMKKEAGEQRKYFQEMYGKK